MTEPTGSLLEAVHAVQQEAPTLPKDKTNNHFGSKYTSLDTIVEKVGPILNKHGLVWVTLPSGTHDEPTLTYRLVHVATQESIDGKMPLLLDKSSAQAMGSALTYTRRYSLCAVLNLVADDDDDGNAAGTRQAGATGQPSEKQLGYLRKILEGKARGIEKPNGQQLSVILLRLGIGVPVQEGWTNLLNRAQVSELLDALTKEPLPSVEHPSDVPEAAEGEFEHPPEKPMEMLG